MKLRTPKSTPASAPTSDTTAPTPERPGLKAAQEMLLYIASRADFIDADQGNAVAAAARLVFYVSGPETTGDSGYDMSLSVRVMMEATAVIIKTFTGLLQKYDDGSTFWHATDTQLLRFVQALPSIIAEARY